MTRDPIDFSAVNSVALRHLPNLVAKMLPGGKRARTEWVSTNPKRGDNSAGSFSINLLTGKWADFATGDAGGISSVWKPIFTTPRGSTQPR